MLSFSRPPEPQPFPPQNLRRSFLNLFSPSSSLLLSSSHFLALPPLPPPYPLSRIFPPPSLSPPVPFFSILRVNRAHSPVSMDMNHLIGSVFYATTGLNQGLCG